MKVLLLHGVNLNMFGKRDPKQYGTVTLDEINSRMQDLGTELGAEVIAFQTNSEGEMVDRIHAAFTEGVDAVVINPGAWTHYSYAIRDALEILTVPIIEVHMSDIHAREPWRRVSVIQDVAKEQISGFGVDSYLRGLRAGVALARGGRSFDGL